MSASLLETHEDVGWSADRVIQVRSQLGVYNEL